MGVMGGVRRRCDTVTAFMFLPKDQPDPRRGRGGAALTPINNTLSLATIIFSSVSGQICKITRAKALKYYLRALALRAVISQVPKLP